MRIVFGLNPRFNQPFDYGNYRANQIPSWTKNKKLISNIKYVNKASLKGTVLKTNKFISVQHGALLFWLRILTSYELLKLKYFGLSIFQLFWCITALNWLSPNLLIEFLSYFIQVKVIYDVLIIIGAREEKNLNKMLKKYIIAR